MKNKLKLVQTILATDNDVRIAINNDVTQYLHCSVYEGIEPCSGVLRRWDTPQNHIRRLENIIEDLKNVAKIYETKNTKPDQGHARAIICEEEDQNL